MRHTIEFMSWIIMRLPRRRTNARAEKLSFDNNSRETGSQRDQTTIWSRKKVASENLKASTLYWRRAWIFRPHVRRRLSWHWSTVALFVKDLTQFIVCSVFSAMLLLQHLKKKSVEFVRFWSFWATWNFRFEIEVYLEMNGNCYKTFQNFQIKRFNGNLFNHL